MTVSTSDQKSLSKADKLLIKIEVLVSDKRKKQIRVWKFVE